MVFGLPGLGRAAVEGALAGARAEPLAALLLAGAAVALLHLLLGLAALALDPRLTAPGR
jgi:ABC-type dipeptide/oligopeptide/nickel transport system permease component